MAQLNIIVAASSNNIIGIDNNIPWMLPTDMKYFKYITFGSTLIMGRKCWDSIPNKFKPLPNRLNVVVTRNTSLNFDYPNTDVENDLEKTLILYKSTFGNPFFVIGGSEIYKVAFPFADKLYLTRILDEIDGTVFLEGFNPEEWNLIEESNVLEENGYKFKFEIYVRKKFEIEKALKQI